LVLSEIRRRKDMRAQQPQEPQGTVAEDLASTPQTYDQAGIRSLRTPGYEEEERASPDDMQEMREGGIVRMQPGGQVYGQGNDLPYSSYSPEDDAMIRRRLQIVNPVTGFFDRVGEAFGGVFSHRPGSQNPSGPLSTRPSRNQILQSGLPPMSELERQAEEAERESRVADVFNQQERTAQAAEAASGRAIDSRVQAMADIRSRISGGTPTEQAIREVVPGYRNVNEGELRQAFGLPPLPAPPPAAAPTTQAGEQPPSATPPEAAGANTPGAAAAAPGSPAGPAAAGAAAGGGGGAAAGIRGVGAGAVGAGDGVLAGMQRLESAFPNSLAALRAELEKGRTNPQERRREAQNLALVEAGLRMAASRNPSFLGSIGEGATPAVQSYAQQLGQIRQDERQDIRDRFSLEQANLQRMYALGQISAAEYRTRVAEAGANARLAASEAGANERLRLGNERLAQQDLNSRRTAASASLRSNTELRDLGTQAAELQRFVRNAREGSAERSRFEAQLTQVRDRIRNIERETYSGLGLQMQGSGPPVDYNYVPGTGAVRVQ
jgi:hypothetical protein